MLYGMRKSRETMTSPLHDGFHQGISKLVWTLSMFQTAQSAHVNTTGHVSGKLLKVTFQKKYYLAHTQFMFKNKQKKAGKKKLVRVKVGITVKLYVFATCWQRCIPSGRFLSINDMNQSEILPTDNPLADHLPNPCRISSHKYQRLALQSLHSHKNQRSRSRLFWHYLFYVISINILPANLRIQQPLIRSRYYVYTTGLNASRGRIFAS